jgi:hypothetical protein
MSVAETLTTIVTKFAVLKTYTASTISFSGDSILDSANGFTFPSSQNLKIVGSSRNDGTVFVETVAAGSLVTTSDLVAESAGALVTITWGPERVYTDPRDAVSVTDFPAIVPALAPGFENELRVVNEPDPLDPGDGVLRDNYTVVLYVLVGTRQQPLAESHSRIKPWPQAIAKILAADVMLGLHGTYLDVEDSGAFDPLLFKYRVGPIQWSDGLYFGASIFIPVTERFDA